MFKRINNIAAIMIPYNNVINCKTCGLFDMVFFSIIASNIFLIACCISILTRSASSFSNDAILFQEDFNQDVFSSGEWVKSQVERYRDQPILIKAPRNPLPGWENDTALEMSRELKFYGVGTILPHPIENTGTDLVIQYETKFTDILSCGGAYLKFLRPSDNLNLEELDSNTPYSIMFGPDKCEKENKVHFILQYQNPISKVWSEHHFNKPPHAKVDKKHHLYTLVIKKSGDFEISIDLKMVRNGHVLKDMVPPIIPPREVPDPEDLKPATWVDEEFITDTSAVKPSDWDETAPEFIDDFSDSKPIDWLDDEKEMIPDPAAIKPKDWDDEEVILLLIYVHVII